MPQDDTLSPLTRAISLILKTQHTKRAYLQRKLNLTDKQAIALMTDLEAVGVLSRPNRHGSRSILIEDADDLERRNDWSEEEFALEEDLIPPCTSKPPNPF